MYSILRFFLFLLPAETAHRFSLNALDVLQKLKLITKIGLAKKRASDNQQTVSIAGVDFPGRVGLAAGLDKNAEHIDALAALGFDFIEVGTVTPKPQDGNPKPRLFRLPEHKAIINRMGFNNGGLDQLVQNVKASRFDGVLGINIGKNKNTPNERAIDDYLICMQTVYPLATYITVNLSSPNTPGLRELQFGEALYSLLTRLKQEQNVLATQHNKQVPLFVKIAPDLEINDLEHIADIILKAEMDGVIISNTTIDKSAVANHPHGSEQGGLSGAPVQEKSTKIITAFHQYTQGKMPIIGVGGIDDAKSAQEKLAAGAQLVQVYTGFIYQGPALIRNIKKAIN